MRHQSCLRHIGVIATFIFMLMRCATSQSAQKTSSTCFRASAIVTADDGAGNLIAPGVPIDIVVRSKAGRVLQMVQADREGKATFDVCWSKDDPAWQIEASMRFEPQFVGTLASFFNYTDTYCLTLPNRIGGHCGEWGTGANTLLSGK